MTDKQKERVLAWVNRQREAMGFKPIKRLKRGEVGEAQKCPLACSLLGRNQEVVVDGEVFYAFGDTTEEQLEKRFEANNPKPSKVVNNWMEMMRYNRDKRKYVKEHAKRYVDLPKYVAAFVAQFDEGEIPELIR